MDLDEFRRICLMLQDRRGNEKGIQSKKHGARMTFLFLHSCHVSSSFSLLFSLSVSARRLQIPIPLTKHSVANGDEAGPFPHRHEDPRYHFRHPGVATWNNRPTWKIGGAFMVLNSDSVSNLFKNKQSRILISFQMVAPLHKIVIGNWNERQEKIADLDIRPFHTCGRTT